MSDQDIEQLGGDPDHHVILARRNALLALAVSGFLGATAGCGRTPLEALGAGNTGQRLPSGGAISSGSGGSPSTMDTDGTMPGTGGSANQGSGGMVAVDAGGGSTGATAMGSSGSPGWSIPDASTWDIVRYLDSADGQDAANSSSCGGGGSGCGGCGCT